MKKIAYISTTLLIIFLSCLLNINKTATTAPSPTQAPCDVRVIRLDGDETSCCVYRTNSDGIMNQVQAVGMPTASSADFDNKDAWLSPNSYHKLHVLVGDYLVFIGDSWPVERHGIRNVNEQVYVGPIDEGLKLLYSQYCGTTITAEGDNFIMHNTQQFSPQVLPLLRNQYYGFGINDGGQYYSYLRVEPFLSCGPTYNKYVNPYSFLAFQHEAYGAKGQYNFINRDSKYNI